MVKRPWKSAIAGIITLLMLVSLLAVPAFAEDAKLEPGIYEGSANSVGGPLRVSVEVSEDSIVSVEGVPGYATPMVAPASHAPRAIASLPDINCMVFLSQTITY